MIKENERRNAKFGWWCVKQGERNEKVLVLQKKGEEFSVETTTNGGKKKRQKETNKQEININILGIYY